MFMIQDTQNKTAIQFAIDRIKRIVPIYWIYTIILAIAFYLTPESFREMKLTLKHVISSLFFISDHFNYKSPALYIGWTLELEIMFYLIFSILIWTKLPINANAFLMLGLFLISIYLFKINNIVLEFLFGGAAYIICKNTSIEKSNIYYIPALLSMLFIYYHHDFNSPIRFVYAGIPALILFLSIIKTKDIRSNILIKLGDSSYSIYLIQVFTLPISAKILKKLTPDLNGVAATLIVSTLSIIIGYIAYITLERNIIKIISNKTHRLNKKQPTHGVKDTSTQNMDN